MGIAPFRSRGPLFLMVGMLVGIALTGILLTREGLPEPLATRLSNLIAPPQSGLPAKIEVGTAQPASGTLATVKPVNPASRRAQPSASPSPSRVTVVPGPVYYYPYYPADDHGHDRGGDGGGHH